MRSSHLINIQKLVFSALLVTIGLLLPFLTGQVPTFGSMLLPMHIPVLIGGIILGPIYGFVIGLVLPVLRFLIFGMPPIYPVGLAMTFELAAYGGLSGFAFRHINKPKLLFRTIFALIIAMLGGRVVWGAAQYLIGIYGNGFTIQAFIAGAFVAAWPGIIIQFVIIPPIVRALSHVGALELNRR